MTRSSIAGTVLVSAFLALLVAEQDRPWKRLQVEYREQELTRLRAEKDAITRRSESSLDLASRQLDDARQRLGGRLEEKQRLEAELRSARHATNWSAQDLRRREARETTDSMSLDPEIRAARRKFEEHSKSAMDLEQRLARLHSEVVEAEAQWSAEIEPVRALEERIQALEKGLAWQWIPGLRGLDPSLAVREIVPPGLFRETPTGPRPRVDRCTTCHLAAHPGTLVDETGPHSARLLGCTICHGGNGQATDFSRAGHWPSGAQQEDEWVRKWAFSRKALPRQLILPATLVASGCVTCHKADLETADLETAVTGQRLMRRMGCAGCHDIGAPPGVGALTVDSSGPPLERLAAKTTREWAFHWIRAPRSFRSTTWMPHLFDQATAREVVVIRAIVHTLWSQSERSQSERSQSERAGNSSGRADGNAEAGRKLFTSIGCTGCHLLDEDAVRHQVALERLHGPNLARIGNKVSAEWLHAWLRDPHSHRPDTAMPNLRLTKKEVSDLVAFLMAQRDPSWSELEIPPVNTAVRDQLVLEYLEGEMSLDESATRLAEMESSDKDLYLGQHSLRTHGCLGCHAVSGLELGEERNPGGSLARLYRDPARFLTATGEVLAHRPVHKKASPDYNLSRTEADAILVQLLAAPAHEVAPRRRTEKAERSRVEAEGGRLLEHYNCLGCHRYEGRGQALERIVGQASPPDLTSAGARLSSSWFLEYLEDPSRHTRRPWLSVRMPTFHFQPEEAHALVSFFADRDAEPLLMTPFSKPAKRHVSVGRAVATMLQCDRCHQDSPDVESLSPEQLSPSYGGARSRLRPDWVVEWILDPQGLIPGTSMPATFAKNEDGMPDGSYLTALIGAPMFQIHRARLLPLFDSEDALLAYLSDSGQVAQALRDYLWSLEE